MIDIVIVGLAAWRVSSLIVHEDGPWDVYERLRERLGANRDDDRGTMQRALSCVWCVSVWCVPPLYVVHGAAPLVTAMLAAMAVAVVADSTIRR